MMLCTLSDIKAILGITDDSKDNLLTLLIKQQSALICAYLGYNPQLKEYIEELQAVNNQQLLQLNNRPIRNVISVKINNAEITDYKLLPQYAKNGFLYRGNGWCGAWYTRNMTYDIVSGAYDISVTYTAGWYLPSDDNYNEGADDSLPYDIITACVEAVSERYTVVSSSAQGIKAQSEGGISVTYEGSETIGNGGLSKRVTGMLEAYRIIGVA